MTTIAYKDGVIAYDSQLTNGSGDTITDDNYDKHRLVKNVHFFMSGGACDYDKFIGAYFGDDEDPEIDIAAIIVDDGKVYSSSTKTNGKLWKLEITEMIYSIGSGSDHAITAMDLGCNSVQAVKMAIKRDTFTGGKIRRFKL